MKTYRDLIVWQKSMDLVLKIYAEASKFFNEEFYNLTSQIKRSAVSIPSNIAEGYGRNKSGDYVRFLRIASGSLYELQTQCEICFRLEYLDSKNYEALNSLSTEIEKMLSSLISKIENNKRV